MIQRFGLVVLAIALAGCESQTPVTPVSLPPSESPLVISIQEVVAEQIGMKTEDISPEFTFAEMGADGLDFARIITETQKRLGVTIETEKLTEVTGASDPKEMPAKLTVRQLAGIVEASQVTPAQPMAPEAAEPTEPMPE